MSSIARQIRKNAIEFNLKEFYSHMTPEQYQKGIQIAVERTKEDLKAEFKKKFDSLYKEFEEDCKKNAECAIDTISIELLYELAVQMNAFDEEDPEIREQIIIKVKEIYKNTMDAVKRYSNYKNDNQAQREYRKRKNNVLKFFKL